jgi:hypothetical protein
VGRESPSSGGGPLEDEGHLVGALGRVGDEGLHHLSVSGGEAGGENTDDSRSRTGTFLCHPHLSVVRKEGGGEGGECERVLMTHAALLVHH